MSDQTGSAPTGQAQDETPPVSEEQARQYMEQLRTAPAEQVLTEVLSSLLTAAQAKLGRRDARLLIDTCGLVSEHSRVHLPQQIAGQVDQVLAQLRMGQVEAEKQVASKPEKEPNDLARVPAPPTQSGSPASAQQPPRQDAGSKLWVPGRP